jgi:hypothetical protein
MKALFRTAAVSGLLLGLLATSAQAVPGRGEDELVRRHAEHAVYARTWEINYSTIRFYGGATYLEDSGIQFRLTYNIRCRGGFERSRNVVILEEPGSEYFRARVVRIPRPQRQGRCVIEATTAALSPWDVDVTIIITAQ